MPEIEYRPLYLHLWNKVTDATEALRRAVEAGDPGALERAALRCYADLTGAQMDTEEMYMSQ